MRTMKEIGTTTWTDDLLAWGTLSARDARIREDEEGTHAGRARTGPVLGLAGVTTVGWCA